MVTYRHSIVQQSPRVYSSGINETLDLSPSPQALATTILFSTSVDLAILDSTSHLKGVVLDLEEFSFPDILGCTMYFIISFYPQTTLRGGHYCHGG